MNHIVGVKLPVYVVRTIVLGLMAMTGACSQDNGQSGSPLGVELGGPALEWESVLYSPGRGESVNVGTLPADGSPRGAIFVFSGGGGFASLVEGDVGRYWSVAAPEAGYVIVGVEIYGPSLQTLAGEVMPALLDWLAAKYPSAVDDVVLSGVSNGGVAIFFAALAAPDRVHGLIGMPGRYVGTGSLSSLAAVPVWLLVGELDSSTIPWSQATFDSLAAVGAPVQMDIIAGQGHLLDIPQSDLTEWVKRRQPAIQP